MLDGYPGNNSSVEQAWDFIQRTVSLPAAAFAFGLMAGSEEMEHRVKRVLLRVKNEILDLKPEVALMLCTFCM